MSAAANAPDAVALTRDFIALRSTTRFEKSFADHLESLLAGFGYTVERHLVAAECDTHPPRENILAYRGARADIQVLFNSHLDTVPPHIPLSEDAENLYGRGACDPKASIAAQITAAQLMHADNSVPDGSIGLLYVVGEEVDHAGMIASNALNLSPRYVIVGEPTENRLAVGHKGMVRFNVHASGKAAHSGYPEFGVSAIHRLLDALALLRCVDFPADPRMGPTTLNIGKIEGGAAANIIPASASASCSLRVATTAAESWGLITSAVAHLEGITLDLLKADDKVVCHTVDGFETTIAAYFTDIPALKGAHKSCLLGPGSILVAHGEDEFVRKQDIIDAVGLYTRLVKSLLASDS